MRRVWKVIAAIGAVIILASASWQFSAYRNRMQRAYLTEQFTQGLHATAEGRYDVAIELFSEVIESEPGNPMTYNARGTAYARKRDFAAAVLDYDKAIQLFGPNNKYYFYRAICHDELGDSPAVIRDCTDAIRMDISYSPAYQRRGNAYLRLGDRDKAIADFTEAIKFAREGREIYYESRGKAYADAGELKKAEIDLKEAEGLRAVKERAKGISK